MKVVDAEIAASGGTGEDDVDPLADAPTAVPLPAPGLPDLAKMIPSKSRTKFIRKMFRKDAEYYASVIAELNATATWEGASAYLRDLFTLNKLDPFAEVVVEFTDVVHSRYGKSG
jgi:hypothetical protein